MFELLLTLHILFAFLLMTHLIGSAFWKARADRSQNAEAIATATQALVRSDLMFAAPGIVGLVGTGIWMVGLTGWERFEEPWLAASFLLTILFGILWLAALMPQQHRMARLARENLSGNPHVARYRQASRLWSISAGIVSLIPIAVLFLMVFKP